MIFVGADHRGLVLKAAVNTWLKNRGYEFEDVGAYEFNQEDDYVDFAVDVAQRVVKQKGMGILICASGVGVDIAANKVEGVRCALGFALEQVTAARRDDNINVLALPSDFIDGQKGVMLVERFLVTPFTEYDKYLRRIEKIARYETT